MKILNLQNILLMTTCLGLSNISLSQHSQQMHENLVDDFYSPFPVSLASQQTFAGTIGNKGRAQMGTKDSDLWDFYVFESPVPGKVEIRLSGFRMPVNLALEKHSHRGPKKRETIAESINR